MDQCVTESEEVEAETSGEIMPYNVLDSLRKSADSPAKQAEYERVQKRIEMLQEILSCREKEREQD